MTTRHHLSTAEKLYRGNCWFPPYNGEIKRRGLEFPLVSVYELDAPAAADTDSMIKAATSTELPNTETVTYTPDTDGTSPTDGVQGTATIDGTTYWELDAPRNLTAAATHASSVVAMTIVVTGLDEYKQAMVEQLDIAATGTSQTDAGKKAFKYIRSIAITAAADAEANTLNMGFGDVFGLPFKLSKKSLVLAANADGSVEDFTLVVGDATTATATTGDVRGTFDPTTAADASVNFAVAYVVDPSTKESAFGIAQYDG